jgi:hypothetical protein
MDVNINNLVSLESSNVKVPKKIFDSYYNFGGNLVIVEKNKGD